MYRTVNKNKREKVRLLCFTREEVPEFVEYSVNTNMSATNISSKQKPRKRPGKKSQKISFDEEIVPKSIAQQFKHFDNKNSKESELHEKPRNKTKQKTVVEYSNSVSSESHQPKKPKRKKKISQSEKSTETNENTEREENIQPSEEQPNDDAELDPSNPVIKSKESKRAQKRKKHQQLLFAKKVKVDLVLQEKSLNYLSRWKHNRNEWKFEKLRQVWLQQSMFDCDKVPERFWETLVEYFSSAKGQIRKTILDEALKIIKENEREMEQNDEEAEKESEDDNNINKAQRARYIIQCLQE